MCYNKNYDTSQGYEFIGHPDRMGWCLLTLTSKTRSDIFRVFDTSSMISLTEMSG